MSRASIKKAVVASVDREPASPAQLSYFESLRPQNIASEAFRRLAARGREPFMVNVVRADGTTYQQNLSSPEDYKEPDFTFPFPADSYRRVEAWAAQLESQRQILERLERAVAQRRQQCARSSATFEEAQETLERCTQATRVMAGVIVADKITPQDVHELDFLITDWQEEQKRAAALATRLEKSLANQNDAKGRVAARAGQVPAVVVEGRGAAAI